MQADRRRRRAGLRSRRATAAVPPSRGADCAGPSRRRAGRARRRPIDRPRRQGRRNPGPRDRRPRRSPRQVRRARCRSGQCRLNRRSLPDLRSLRRPWTRRYRAPRPRPMTRRPPRQRHWPPGSSRPTRSVPSVLRRATGRPLVVPSPGRSGRPGTRSRGSTPPGGRGRAARVAGRRSIDGGDPGRRRARRDRLRRQRMGTPEPRPRGAVRVQSPGDDTGPLSPRPRAVVWSASVRSPPGPPERPPVGRPDRAARA